MLPMNIDLIDTLVFERQHDIQLHMHRMAIASLESRSVWTRLRSAFGSLAGSDRTRTPEPTVTMVPAVDRPAALMLLHTPTPIEAEALERAA